MAMQKPRNKRTPNPGSAPSKEESRPTSELNSAQTEQQKVQAQLAKMLALNVNDIGLLVRNANLLEERGLVTVRDLLRCPDLTVFDDVGPKIAESVFARLEIIGFFRAGKGPDGKSGFFPEYAVRQIED